MHLRWVALARLLAPTLIVGGALLAREYMPGLDGDARVILVNLPYLIAVACLVMAYQFRRLRLMLATVGITSLYWLIQNHLQVSLAQPDAARLFLVASLALPLLCLYLLLIPERGMFNTYGAVVTVFFLGIGGACFALADVMLQAALAEGNAFSARPVEDYVLSAGASKLVLAALVIGLGLVVLRDTVAESVLLGVLASGFFSLALLHLDDISIAMGIAGGLCLVWGLLRSSYAMAYRDELTGLLSRRALNERLNTLGRRNSIAMLEVDHFKRYNDKHGHDVGDEVLKLVASRVSQVGNGGNA